MYRTCLLLLTLGAVMAGPMAPLVAQTLPRLYPDDYEIALARTAAPASLSANADVYVLRRGGHVKVVSGTNGAACMVSRDHQESLYPICYDPEGARTMLRVALEESRLRERGLGPDSIDAQIQEAIAAGQFPVPSTLGIAYMMSRHQVIYDGARGRRVGSWFPHLMMYMPYATKAGLAMSGLPTGDLTLSDEGKPTAHYVVMTRDWAVAAPLPSLPSVMDVTPGWVCPGDEYVIRWVGPSSAELRSTAGGRTERSALPEGRLTAAATTELEVFGSDGASLAAETVTVHPDRMEHNFVRPVSSCAGRLSVASMAIPPPVGSDRIRPRQVTNRGGHPVTITHRGVTARLQPGEGTEQFNHVPFTGDWGVVVDTGESNPYCPPGQEPSPPVDVLIVTACAQKV